MSKKILFLVHGFFIKTSLSHFLNVDSSLDPSTINQNQIFINRKERFIKFDTNGNELEIELGISIPFIKVPLVTGGHMGHNEHKEAEITINAPGVIVAGMLMLTSFIIIPFLFSTSPSEGFAFQRREEDGFWSVLRNVDDALSRNGIDSSSCVQKSICWIAKNSQSGEKGSPGDWINYVLKSWWFKRLAVGTIVEQALEENTCGTKFSECSLTSQRFQSFVEMVKAGHGRNS